MLFITGEALLFCEAYNECIAGAPAETSIDNFGETYSHENILKQELEFRPHMTIAYRDLRPNLFKQAWKEYETRKYVAEFDVNSFHLLQHDGKAWNIISSYNLEYVGEAIINAVYMSRAFY
jgi:hypothetical protein